MDKYRDSKNRYDEKNIKRYTVGMPIGVYEEMERAFTKLNINRNAYTIQAIKEKLERDNKHD